MVGDFEQIGHLMIARRAAGEPVELVRSPEEVVFLSFDSRIRRLVEMHVLRSGRTLSSVNKRHAFERAQAATQLRGGAFMRVLEVGEDQGLVYYTTNLNDGEMVRDYILRRGPLPAATVFSLLVELLDELLQVREHSEVVSHMRLDRVVIACREDTFLQLRICDYGLSDTEEAEQENGRRMVIQACRLIFLMLTGRAYEDGENPERYPALTALPMGLRTAIRAALADPANAPQSLEKLRDDVREAFSALVSRIQARSSRKQLVMTPATQPRSQLQDILLENVPVESILGARFRAEETDQTRRFPFSLPCINAKNDQSVTVHLLPPSRIVDKSHYEAVPLQMWRFNAERHPNILRSLSLWEGPDWTFLTEEREPGFSLSRLLAERICLNPTEVLILMRQVCAGLDQALECGVQRVDLHPCNIVLRVGKAGPLLNREYERLMQKRLDAWPQFLVKLRAHLTMRNLYEPLLVDRPETGELREAHLADRDYRNRAFAALTAYLLTGERQSGLSARFPEAVSEPLAECLRRVLEASRTAGQAPSPEEFLREYESAMTGPSAPDLATRLRGNLVPIEEMESAGSVSDFDNEWAAPLAGEESSNAWTSPVHRSLAPAYSTNSRPIPRRGAPGWPVWVAAAVVAFGLGGWWLSARPATARPVTVSADLPTAADDLKGVEKLQGADTGASEASDSPSVVDQASDTARNPKHAAPSSDSVALAETAAKVRPEPPQPTPRPLVAGPTVVSMVPKAGETNSGNKSSAPLPVFTTAQLASPSPAGIPENWKSPEVGAESVATRAAISVEAVADSATLSAVPTTGAPAAISDGSPAAVAPGEANSVPARLPVESESQEAKKREASMPTSKPESGPGAKPAGEVVTVRRAMLPTPQDIAKLKLQKTGKSKTTSGRKVGSVPDISASEPASATTRMLLR